VVIQVNYTVGRQVDPTLHARVMTLFGVWGLLSVVFQRLLNRERGMPWIPFAWAVADMVVLTVLLLLDNADFRPGEAHSASGTPFLVAYPCLIVASGLWFRVALVWWTTALSVLSYLVLLTQALLGGETIQAPHRNVIYVVALVTVGFVTAYQVKRVRALSRYYENRPLP
jgi:hypothetical protein